MNKVIHIVYSQSAEGSFKQAIKKKIIKGDILITLYDNLSNGVINNLRDLKGREVWWDELNGDDHYLYGTKDEFKQNYEKFHKDISQISDEDNVYLWHGFCDREICGIMYTINLLKDKEANVYTINVSDKIIEGKHGRVFSYIASSPSEIISEKLGEYFKLARQLEKDEYKKLLNSWEDLVKENSLLRSYRNEKMESVSEKYFDKDILKFTHIEYKKALRTVGEMLGNTEPRITDDFISWRIKELVKSGKISFKGKFGIMREMEICITDKGLEYLNGFPEAMNLWNERIRAHEKKQEFIYEIKEEGRLEERIKIAKSLLDVLDIETIAHKTGLTIGQVKNIQMQE